MVPGLVALNLVIDSLVRLRHSYEDMHNCSCFPHVACLKWPQLKWTVGVMLPEGTELIRTPICSTTSLDVYAWWLFEVLFGGFGLVLYSQTLARRRVW